MLKPHTKVMLQKLWYLLFSDQIWVFGFKSFSVKRYRELLTEMVVKKDSMGKNLKDP